MNLLKSRITKILLCILMLGVSFYLVGCESNHSNDNNLDDLFLVLNSEEKNITFDISASLDGTTISTTIAIDGNKTYLSIFGIEIYYEVLDEGSYVYSNMFGYWTKTFESTNSGASMEDIDEAIDMIATMKTDDFTFKDGKFVLKDNVKGNYDLESDATLTIEYIDSIYTITMFDEEVFSTIKISKLGETVITLPTVTEE